VTAAELDALAEVMVKRKVILLKDGTLHIELHASALMPASVAYPPPAAPSLPSTWSTSPADLPADLAAPWAAFRPPTTGPTQPMPHVEIPGDDDALFATDLPKE
jgi:hypothetical protein